MMEVDPITDESLERFRRYTTDNTNPLTLTNRELQSFIARIDEMQQTFDLRWAADMRAKKMWQAAGEGRELTWPDHADLVVWLLEHKDIGMTCGPSTGGDAVTGRWGMRNCWACTMSFLRAFLRFR